MKVSNTPLLQWEGTTELNFPANLVIKKITKIGTWRKEINPYEMRIPKGKQP